MASRISPRFHRIFDNCNPLVAVLPIHARQRSKRSAEHRSAGADGFGSNEEMPAATPRRSRFHHPRKMDNRLTPLREFICRPRVSAILLTVPNQQNPSRRPNLMGENPPGPNPARTNRQIPEIRKKPSEFAANHINTEKSPCRPQSNGWFHHFKFYKFI